MTQRDESDRLHELKMGAGAGAADAIGALTEDMVESIMAITAASAATFHAATDSGVSPNVAAGLVLGAAVEGIFQ